MAGKRGRPKKADQAPKTIKTNAVEFKRAIADAAGASQRARNASQSKSEALGDFAQKSGFSRKALNFIASLDSQDEIKRDDFVRQILMGYELMGWGAQADLFDSVAKMIKDAAERVEAEKAGKKDNSLPLDEAQRKFEAAAKANPPGGAAEDEADIRPAFLRNKKAAEPEKAG